RQDDARAPAPRVRRADVGRGDVPREEPLEDVEQGLAGVSARGPGDLSGPVRGLQPVLQGRPPSNRANPEAPAGPLARRGTPSHGRGPAGGGVAAGGGARPGSAPAQRRPAAGPPRPPGPPAPSAPATSPR